MNTPIEHHAWVFAQLADKRSRGDLLHSVILLVRTT